MREGEPFKKSLQDSKYSHKIKLLETAPDKVVREYYIHFLYFQKKKRILKEGLKEGLKKNKTKR